MKFSLSLFCLLPLSVWAQTDVTTQYIANPSFENVGTLTNAVNNNADGLRGWNVSPADWATTSPGTQLIINSDCFTDNNGGKTQIADGQYAFYQRFGWGSATSSISQTTKAVPAGRYRLTVDTKMYAFNNAASSVAISVSASGKALKSVTVAAGSGSAGIMASSEWNTQTLDFTLESATTLDIAANMTWGNGGSMLALDNFRLISLPEDYKDMTIVGGTEKEVSSPTEGVITHDFVPEAQMKDGLLQMLANFAAYMKADFQDCAAPNSKDEVCGCFKGENTMGNNEQGVRPNADLSMICAFLVKYGKGKVTLPQGVTWDDVETMAMKSLVFAYSTHKANKLKVCAGNNYWGSTSASDAVWESSLWAMSVAYSAFFQWDKLTAAQKGYIEAMMVAECNYELERSIPTGYAGDTKAEENGWEADILAATLGLFPNHANADKWFKRLREFAINSYSHYSDASNQTVIDPEYDNTTIAQLYKGQNLYDDYTLQNHNLFHTSYQNVVMQELGEAALALKMFQQGLHGTEKWYTNALMHHNKEVHEQVLNHLALADGELAMPNGNDWSLFLFDQITSYSTMACFAQDKDALLLENMAYKYIQARQKTTSDGSWLLRADVGARRMGVEAHRVMMTWLMHEVMSTASVTPSTWDEFNSRHKDAMVFKSQNIVRAASDDRFVCFSWSTGLKSYTGYIASTRPDVNKIVVPFRANNTGNFLGWYTVSGKGTNASPILSGVYSMHNAQCIMHNVPQPDCELCIVNCAFGMNGALSTNDNTLRNDFAIIATPGNAVVYMDNIKAQADATIGSERGGLMAISTDPFTKAKRTLYFADGRIQADGTKMVETTGQWVNIDNQLGFVTNRKEGRMGFGDQSNNNSILTSKLYTLYSNEARTVKAGEQVDSRVVVYYTNVDSAQTSALAGELIVLTAPEGMKAVIVGDPDGKHYLCVANMGCTQPLTVANDVASIYCAVDVNHSKVVPVEKVDGKWRYEETTSQTSQWTDHDRLEDLTAKYIANPSFEEDETWGTTGKITLNGVTYDPCYTQTVEAEDKSFPQVLPVKGWTAVNTLKKEGSNVYWFALRYSMPYSTDTYCVSPSDKGNSASIKDAPLCLDTDAGSRCLSFLNSWTSGTNSISQLAHLPAGEYVLVWDMAYSCPNEQGREGDDCIRATGNINRSLCGAIVTPDDPKAGAGEGVEGQYFFPKEQNTWEEMAIPFKADCPMTLAISMGLETTAAVGAANNARLYIDNVRLYGLEKTTPDAVQRPAAEGARNYYDLQGRRVDGTPAHSGVYINGHKKVVVK